LPAKGESAAREDIFSTIFLDIEHLKSSFSLPFTEERNEKLSVINSILPGGEVE